MIRVLHFVSTPSIGSGVMSVIMNYYRHVDRSKVQFDFLCFIPCEDSHEKEINELGGRVFFVSKPGSSMGSFSELDLFFRRYASQYCCFHNHEVYLSFLLKPLTQHYRIVNFIVHAHATKYSDKPVNKIRNALLCLPLRFMTSNKHQSFLKFACSEAAGRFLYGTKSYRNKEFFLLPNAIDIEAFYFDQHKRKILRREMKLDDNFVIGHIGRFNPQKNHRFLLNVFKELLIKCPNAKLMLVGTGYLMDEIRRKALEELPFDSVMFMGEINNVCELLNAMDVFVLPSLYEGLPVVALEAQANGLPCILSSEITSETKLNDNVVFVPVDKTDLWVNSLLEISLDRKYQAHNGCFYDIGYASKRLEEFYISLV